MKKLLSILLALILLTGCAAPIDVPSSTTTDVPSSTTTEPDASELFEITEEALLLTEENSPDTIGGYVSCPLGYLVNFYELTPDGYQIINGIDSDTLFKVVGVTYITDASCSPSTELESIPPVIREDFINIPHYDPPEDPDNIYDFDYFAYIEAVIPILHGKNGFLLIQETEISPIYCVPPELLQFVGYF